MAKINYYSIHKNKKPKRLRKRKKYVSFLLPKLALINSTSCIQISIINNTIFENKTDRQKQIIEVLVNTTKVVANCVEAEKQIRFTETKRYIK